MVGRVDEDLVDAAGLGGDVHRAEVVDDEAGVAVERRVQVGDDPHPPAAALVDGLQRGEGGFFVAGAERARSVGIGLDLSRPRREVGRTLGPLGHDRDPPPGEWVEAHLTHSAVQDRTGAWPRAAILRALTVTACSARTR